MVPPHPTGKPRRFFTLVELMLVIGVLGVLVSLLLPLLNNAISHARELQCSDNLRQIHTAISTYADTGDGSYPVTYGQLSTEAANRAWTAPGRSSMARLMDALGNDPAPLYCPTFWDAADPTHLGPPSSLYRPGASLKWGYNKFAGTLNTKPLTARRDYYSRYQDINRDLSTMDPGLRHPGYLSVQRVNGALRRFLVMGRSRGEFLGWQSALNPDAVAPLMGPGPIAPSEIALFADSNNMGKTAVSTAHSLVSQSPVTPIVPPVIRGINELLADGHVTWYGIGSGSLYYVSDGEPGGAGVFVQDNR